MKTLYVFGDFEWLESPFLIGELGYESLRGSSHHDMMITLLPCGSIIVIF